MPEDAKTLDVCTQCCQCDDEDLLLCCQNCDNYTHSYCVNGVHNWSEKWLCANCNENPLRFIKPTTKIVLYKTIPDVHQFVTDLKLHILSTVDEIRTVLLLAGEDTCIIVNSIDKFSENFSVLDTYKLLNNIHEKGAWVFSYEESLCSFSDSFYDIIDDRIRTV